MTTRKHIHEEILDADAETIFALLVTPSAIRQWWGASHVIVDRKQGGLWVGLWGDEDSPEFITVNRMSVYDPPKRIVFPTRNTIQAKARSRLQRSPQATSP